MSILPVVCKLPQLGWDVPWSYWSFELKQFLRSEGVWNVVEGKTLSDKEMAKKDVAAAWDRDDGKALFYIFHHAGHWYEELLEAKENLK